MRNIILLFLFMITFVNANSLKWTNGIKNGLERAKKEHKILMIFVEAKHCPWCHKMLDTTLSDKDVVRNLNKDYILVKVDANSKEGREYFPNISITPTTYFVTSKKVVLETIDGYLNTEFFFWSMAKAERKFKEIK